MIDSSKVIQVLNNMENKKEVLFTYMVQNQITTSHILLLSEFITSKNMFNIENTDSKHYS